MGYKLTWVYIRPNGTEQKIRPIRDVFEFDFTDSTGWTFNDATISWWKLQATQSGGWCVYDTGTDIKDSSKITIDATVYGTTWSWVWLIYLMFCDWLSKPENTATPMSWMIVNYMTSAGYKNSGTKVNHDAGYWNDIYTVTETKYWNGIEMPIHYELDVVNKTVTFSMNNTLIGTDTVSDADIASFKATSRTKFGISLSQTSWYVSYLKLTIE